MDAPAFRRSLLVVTSLCFLCSTVPAATVNVGLVEGNPIQATSGVDVPDGTALFIVSYKTTQDAFFTALRGANSADTLVSVFQNELQFFNLNNTPTVKGVGGETDPEEPSSFRGWTSGNPLIDVSTSSKSLLPIFALFSSSTNLVSTASFLLVRSRATSEISYIPVDNSNSDIEISGNKTLGSDIIFGQYLSSTETSGAFRMATAGAYGQITSDTTLTINAGSNSTYQILSNHGADSFGATSLPAWASIDSSTGVITLSPSSGDTGTFTLGLSAINSLTGKTATGSLDVTVQAASGPTFTSSPTATATAGVAFSYPITTDAPSTFTATSLLPSGLSLDSATGVLSGIPISATTSTITIRAARTANAASFTPQNLVLTVSSPTLAIADLVSGQLTRTAGTAYTIPVTIPAGFTVDSGSITPTISGVTYSAGNLLISSTAAPLAKAKSPDFKTSEAVTLTLNRTSGLDGATVSASLPFNLRLVAPAPTALTTAGPFQVPVGEDYSLQLATDVSAICPNQIIMIVDEDNTLRPIGLINNSAELRKTGLITGKNTSTTLPWDFSVDVVADTSTYYEGGGTLTVPVRFQLYNTAAPMITSSTQTKLAGVGRPFSQYSITASGAPFQFTATDLPPGLALVGANITGTPTSAGIKTVRLKAYSYFRPGDPSSILMIGDAYFQIYVSGAKPTKTASVFGADNLRVGTAASLSAGEGYRVNGYGLPPGLIFDRATGLITGTPTVAGTFTPTLFIQNSLGWISRTVTLRVQ